MAKGDRGTRKRKPSQVEGRREGGAGNPGPVYGQKDQAPSPWEKETTETKGRANKKQNQAERATPERQTKTKAKQPTQNTDNQIKQGGQKTRGKGERGKGRDHSAEE